MSKSVLLISTPWAHTYMPSIQLGSLKSYLIANGVACDACHLYLDVAHAIGFKTYAKIWFPYPEDGESLYSFLLYPELIDTVRSDHHIQAKINECKNYQLAAGEPFSLALDSSDDFIKQFASLHEDIVDQLDLTKYSVVGFTLNFGQTISSLYLAQLIKDRNLDCKVIFGGAEASSSLGVSIVRNFQQVDFACDGEGEKCLAALAKALETSPPSLHDVPGLIYEEASEIKVNKSDQLRQMLSLPTPDYREYFDRISAERSISVPEVCSCLPIEGSRGCYYSCTFCALNLQWRGIRVQDKARLAAQMEELSTEYGILDFFFVDNVNSKHARETFTHIASSGRDYRFFHEIRADTDRNTLAAMKAAGMTKVQIGIEALSTSLLSKFNKRTRVIINLQSMKNCFELGIAVSANLIVDHPASTDDDIEETLHVMEFAKCFPPPDGVCPFALEVGSPDFAKSGAGSLTIGGNFRRYKRMYPQRMLDVLDLPRKEFFPTSAQSDWSPVIALHKQWKEHYERNVIILGERHPQLALFDAKSFLRIEDFRQSRMKVFLLNELERDLYLFGNQITSLAAYYEAFPRLSRVDIQNILEEFVALRIMFREDDDYLSLAMRFRTEIQTAVEIPGQVRSSPSTNVPLFHVI